MGLEKRITELERIVERQKRELQIEKDVHEAIVENLKLLHLGLVIGMSI